MRNNGFQALLDELVEAKQAYAEWCEEYQDVYGSAGMAPAYRRVEELQSQVDARVEELREELAAYQSTDCAEPRHLCTPEERKVLEAMGNTDIYEMADGCPAFASIYHERFVCQAELANRAAKAKRGET
jgi:hypothetical protein